MLSSSSAFTSLIFLASDQTAFAQLLLAQTGGGKTAIGWLIVLLCIVLGLLIVCRPSSRTPANGKKR
jgi:hypothetical protein